MVRLYNPHSLASYNYNPPLVAEDFLGLPLVDALMLEATKTGGDLNFLHTFYQMDDGSCMAFFEIGSPDEVGRPFTFKEQSDFGMLTHKPNKIVFTNPIPFMPLRYSHRAAGAKL